MTSGVPQGTVLGPLLFLLYVNDLPDGLNSPVRLFADDALLYGIISNDTDGNKIQDGLRKLEQWQYKWQMDFNPSKCKVVCFSTKKDPSQKTYELCGVALEEVKYTSNLGVTLDHKSKWGRHIQDITAKANSTLGVKRNLWNCPREVKEIAYQTIVRPKLEYACASWDPYYKKDIVKVESVQRKAARFQCTPNYQQTASVTDMIKELGWDSLESRSKKARLNLMYKLAHRLINIDTVNHLESHSEMRTRGSHSFKYRIPKFYKDVFKFSFFLRTI